MKKRGYFVAVVLAALLTGLCALSPVAGAASDQSAGTPVIAVIPKSMDNPIFDDMMMRAQEAGEELGAVVILAGPTTSDGEKQAEVVEALIEKGVDGMLISCNDAEQMREVIDRAVDAGITVATFDSDSPDSKRVFYIGSDNYALGQEAARQMRSLLPDGGKIAVLEGNPDALNLKERLAGFYDGLEGSQIECYPAVSGQDDMRTSVEVVESFTEETEELDAWFLAGGWPLFAEIEELPNLTRFAGEGGHVVAIDISQPILKYVDAGIVDVLIGQGYEEMGDRGMRTLIAAINEESPYSGDEVLYAAIQVVAGEGAE